MSKAETVHPVEGCVGSGKSDRKRGDTQRRENPGETRRGGINLVILEGEKAAERMVGKEVMRNKDQNGEGGKEEE